MSKKNLTSLEDFTKIIFFARNSQKPQIDPTFGAISYVGLDELTSNLAMKPNIYCHWTERLKITFWTKTGNQSIKKWQKMSSFGSFLSLLSCRHVQSSHKQNWIWGKTPCYPSKYFDQTLFCCSLLFSGGEICQNLQN